MRDPIKIGWARSTVNRFSKLQAGCPFGMHYIASFEGGQQHEANLHHKFAAYRFRCEWFFGADEILNYLRDAIRRETLECREWSNLIEYADLDPRVNFGGYGVNMPVAKWVLSYRRSP